MILTASVAWSVPMAPGRTPRTPASAHEGARCGRRRLRVQAAVARTLARPERRDLAVEAEDRTVDDRNVLPDARIVDEVARGEVVEAVHDDVPILIEDAVDVLAREALVERDDVHIGVQVLDGAFAALHLRLADAIKAVQDLTLKVRLVDGVAIDEADRSDACGREVEGRR